MMLMLWLHDTNSLSQEPQKILWEKVICQMLMDVWLLRRLCHLRSMIDAPATLKWCSRFSFTDLIFKNRSNNDALNLLSLSGCWQMIFLSILLTLCEDVISVQVFSYFRILGVILVQLTFLCYGGGKKSTAAVWWNKICSMSTWHNTRSHCGL